MGTVVAGFGNHRDGSSKALTARRWVLGLSLSGAMVLACAEPPPESEPPEFRAPFTPPPPLRLNLPSTRAFGAEHEREATVPLRLAAAKPLWQRVSVVELPPDNIPGSPPRRAHHALSIATDAPKPLLRGLGLEPSECATQFRAPSQVRQSRGVVAVDLQAQVRLRCRF